MMTTLFNYINLLLLGLAVGAVPGDEAGASLLSNKLFGGCGLLGIDPQLAAMIFSVVALAQGLLFVLAPMPQAVLYGVNKADPAVVQHDMEFIGASIFAVGISPAMMIFQGAEPNYIAVVEMTFWLVFFLRSLLNSTHKKAGMSTDKLLVIAASALVGLYGAVYEATWTWTYFKAVDILYALVAIQEIFFVDSAKDFWGITMKEDEKPVGRFLGRAFGYFHLQYRIQSYCLISGLDPAKAMAYGAFSGLAHFLSGFFVTKDIPEVAGFPAAYTYAFWLVFYSFMIPTILLEQ